jgi:hypothetical protein
MAYTAGNENFFTPTHEFFALNAKGVCNSRRPGFGDPGSHQRKWDQPARTGQNLQAFSPETDAHNKKKSQGN